MINIAVCDDSVHAVDMVADIYALAGGKTEITVDLFKSADALKNEMKLRRFSVVFLDPDVSDSAGISFAKEIREAAPECEIILLNKSEKYAVAGYSVFASGYLITPASKKDIMTPLLRAIEKCEKRPSVLFKDKNGARIAVNIAELLYIEVIGTELHIHIKNGVIKCQGSLNEACHHLPPTQFYRSHRSYVVNMNCVLRAIKYHFVMENGDKVTIAKNRYAEAKRKLQDFVE